MGRAWPELALGARALGALSVATGDLMMKKLLLLVLLTATLAGCVVVPPTTFNISFGL